MASAGGIGVIPRHDVALNGSVPEDMEYWSAADQILDEVEHAFGRRALTVFDTLSRRWLRARDSVLLSEIDAFALRLRRPGVYFLNLSFEWSCTVGVHSDSQGHVIMKRAFDWGPRSLGPTVRVVERRGPRPYAALTWPMFVGEATIVAPGRFSIALNRAPGPGLWAEQWFRAVPLRRLIDAVGFYRSRGEPPAHVLRRVAERAETSTEAIEMLSSAALCRNAIFVIAGIDLDTSGVIERRSGKVHFRPAPAVAANHFEVLHRPYSPDSQSRSAWMAQCLNAAESAHWCRWPVINPMTRFASQIEMPSGRHHSIAFLDGQVIANGIFEPKA